MGLDLVLVTLGDPNCLTGGHGYNRRVAERAALHDARVSIVSAAERPFPALLADGPGLIARALAFRPDALLIDSLVTAALALPLAARRPPVPVVGLLHHPPGGVDRRGPRTRLQATLDRRFYGLAERLIVPSHWLAADLRSAGVAAERIRVVPPGTELPEPALGVDLGRAARPAFLCVAPWLPDRGLHLLLEAFAHLPATAGSLHLVGDPDVEPVYARRMRARLRLADLLGRVVVHGRRSPEEVAALYRAADVFVLPSLGETHGMVFAEALAAGLPSVAFRVGHVPDLVDAGVTGLLVEPGDVPALTAALEHLALDADLRRAMAEAAWRVGAALPTWDDTAGGVVAAVREAVGRDQHRRPRGDPVESRAVWLTGPRRVELRAETVAEPAPDQVRVRARLSAISHGTEMLVYRGQVPADLPLDLPTLAGSFAFPIKYGYASVGEVEEAGVDVRGLRRGDLVFTLHPHQERYVVPASLAVRLPDGTPAQAGIFYANLETAVNVLLDTPLRFGETGVVFGQGIVGHLVALLLRRSGARQVIAVDPIRARRARALQAGADAALPPDEALAERVGALTSGRGADVVVEASGAPAALQQALAVVATQGTVVVASWHGAKPAPLSLGTDFHRRRLRIVSTQVGTLDPALAPRWDLARRRELVTTLLRELPLAGLVTHGVPFERAADAYRLVDERADEVLQVVLNYTAGGR